MKILKTIDSFENFQISLFHFYQMLQNLKIDPGKAKYEIKNWKIEEVKKRWGWRIEEVEEVEEVEKQKKQKWFFPVKLWIYRIKNEQESQKMNK